MNSKVSEEDVHETREQLRCMASLLRLEGDYVGAQDAERQLMSLNNAPLRLMKSQHKQKSAA